MPAWVKLESTRATHRKLRQAGFAARGLDEAAICQIAFDMTDGFVSLDTVEMLGIAHGEKNWRRLADRLVEVGRWEVADGGWLVHDYLDYNPTRRGWEEEVAKRRESGRMGGRAKAANRTQPEPTHVASARARASRAAVANPVARASQLASGLPDTCYERASSKPLANALADYDLEKDLPPPPPPHPKTGDPPRRTENRG